MRAREILQENYMNSLMSDLDNLLVKAKALGKNDIKTSDLVKWLHSMGYSIDMNSIMPLLEDNPLVFNFTSEIITLVSDEATSDDDASDSGDRVEDMAQKAADKMPD